MNKLINHSIKQVLILALSLYTSSYSNGQNYSLIDSLTTTLQLSHDEERVETYLKLAYAYRKSHADSTIFYCNKAIEIARSLGLSHQVATSYNFLGLAYHYLGNNVQSESYYKTALEYSEEFQDSSQYAHAANNLGKHYLRAGDFYKSYEYYKLALDIFQKVNDKDGMAFTYKGLSEVYRLQNDFQKALDMSENAVRIRLQLGHSEDLVSSMIEHAAVYDMMGQHEAALKRYLEAKSQAEIVNDEISVARINTGICQYYFKQGDYISAIIFGKKALKLASKTRNLALITSVNFELGRAFFEKGEIAKSKSFFHQVLDKADLSRDAAVERESYYYLSTIAHKEDNVSLAYDYIKKYADLKLKIDNDEAARKIRNIEIKADLENRERENELLKANELKDMLLIENQQAQTKGTAAIGFMLFLLAIYLWTSSARRNRRNIELKTKIETISSQNEKISNLKNSTAEQNDLLISKNERLKELNDEKESIMHIVAHDLRSPLNNVKGVTQILQTSDLTDNQQVTIGKMKQTALSGTDLISNLLDMSNLEFDSKELVVREVSIRSVMKNTSDTYSDLANSKQMELKLDQPENNIMLKSNESYIQRILHNLTSNAIKFSPIGSTISLKSQENDSTIFLSVKDSGPGFSDEDKQNLFKKFTPLSAQPTGGEKSNGLGLAITKTLVERLKGDLLLVSEHKKGSEFTVALPKINTG